MELILPSTQYKMSALKVVFTVKMLDTNLFGKKIGDNRTEVSEKCWGFYNDIKVNVTGLTYDELVVAMKMILEDVESTFILLPPPVQELENQN